VKGCFESFSELISLCVCVCVLTGIVWQISL